MAPSLPQINPIRLRSYIFRLPLFTRTILLLLILIWILELQSIWDVTLWGELIPKEVGIGSMQRLNTYPLIHSSLLHVLLCAAALTPLLERFEAEHGTLVSLAMFLGPFSTFTAGLYILIERFILRQNTPIKGASLWVFVLLAIESIKTFKTHPYFSLGPYKIPTWTSPLAGSIFLAILVPQTTFLGHLCAIVIGYLFGIGYLKHLAPPEKILRWVEGKMNLLGRLPHYVSVDQKTYGRYGVLPSSNSTTSASVTLVGSREEEGTGLSFLGNGQRLG